jgi:hypothetical protein
MNAAAADNVRTALGSAARNFQPTRRSRFKLLAALKEEIRELRTRGASFETIAELLKKHSVKTSHESVRRFYREVIEQKPVSRKRRRTSRRKQITSITSPPRGAAKSADVRKAGTHVSSSRPERGPRIARIEDL